MLATPTIYRFLFSECERENMLLLREWNSQNDEEIARFFYQLLVILNF
jgi:hypothetical protein